MAAIAAVQVRELGSDVGGATAAIEIEPGVGGDLVAIAPLAEPLSAGAPPVTPALVEQASLARPEGLRSVRAGSGQLITAALATAGRARFSVRWGSLTEAEADSLRDFFELELLAGGGDGAVLAFEIEPDGPGGGVGTVKVRALGPLRLSLRANVSGGAGVVYEGAEVECERVE